MEISIQRTVRTSSNFADFSLSSEDVRSEEERAWRALAKRIDTVQAVDSLEDMLRCTEWKAIASPSAGEEGVDQSPQVCLEDRKTYRVSGYSRICETRQTERYYLEDRGTYRIPGYSRICETRQTERYYLEDRETDRDPGYSRICETRQTERYCLEDRDTHRDPGYSRICETCVTREAEKYSLAYSQGEISEHHLVDLVLKDLKLWDWRDTNQRAVQQVCVCVGKMLGKQRERNAVRASVSPGATVHEEDLPKHEEEQPGGVVQADRRQGGQKESAGHQSGGLTSHRERSSPGLLLKGSGQSQHAAPHTHRTNSNDIVEDVDLDSNKESVPPGHLHNKDYQSPGHLHNKDYQSPGYLHNKDYQSPGHLHNKDYQSPGHLYNEDYQSPGHLHRDADQSPGHLHRDADQSPGHLHRDADQSPGHLHRDADQSPGHLHRDADKSPGHLHRDADKSPGHLHRDADKSPGHLHRDADQSPGHLHRDADQSPGHLHRDAYQSPGHLHRDADKSPGHLYSSADQSPRRQTVCPDTILREAVVPASSVSGSENTDTVSEQELFSGVAATLQQLRTKLDLLAEKPRYHLYDGRSRHSRSDSTDTDQSSHLSPSLLLESLTFNISSEACPDSAERDQAECGSSQHLCEGDDTRADTDDEFFTDGGHLSRDMNNSNLSDWLVVEEVYWESEEGDGKRELSFLSEQAQVFSDSSQSGNSEGEGKRELSFLSEHAQVFSDSSQSGNSGTADTQDESMGSEVFSEMSGVFSRIPSVDVSSHTSDDDVFCLDNDVRREQSTRDNTTNSPTPPPPVMSDLFHQAGDQQTQELIHLGPWPVVLSPSHVYPCTSPPSHQVSGCDELHLAAAGPTHQPLTSASPPPIYTADVHSTERQTPSAAAKRKGPASFTEEKGLKRGEALLSETNTENDRRGEPVILAGQALSEDGQFARLIAVSLQPLAGRSTCVADTETQVHVSPSSPDTETQVHVSPSSPDTETQVHVSPSSPDTETQVQVSPSSPDTETQVRVSPSSPDTETQVHVSPSSPDTETQVHVSPSSPDTETSPDSNTTSAEVQSRSGATCHQIDGPASLSSPGKVEQPALSVYSEGLHNVTDMPETEAKDVRDVTTPAAEATTTNGVLNPTHKDIPQTAGQDRPGQYSEEMLQGNAESTPSTAAWSAPADSLDGCPFSSEERPKAYLTLPSEDRRKAYLTSQCESAEQTLTLSQPAGTTTGPAIGGGVHSPIEGQFHADKANADIPQELGNTRKTQCRDRQDQDSDTNPKGRHTKEEESHEEEEREYEEVLAVNLELIPDSLLSELLSPQEAGRWRTGRPLTPDSSGVHDPFTVVFEIGDDTLEDILHAVDEGGEDEESAEAVLDIEELYLRSLSRVVLSLEAGEEARGRVSTPKRLPQAPTPGSPSDDLAVEDTAASGVLTFSGVCVNGTAGDDSGPQQAGAALCPGQDDSKRGVSTHCQQDVRFGPPDKMPTETRPDKMPTETRPDKMPTETRPDKMPTETRPDNMPIETQPDNMPTETQPDNMPIETQPDNMPTETRPDNMPTETRPDNMPTETRPDNMPIETQPDNMPTETRPDNMPTETRPDNMPIETQPDNMPIETQPDNMPTETRPALPQPKKTDREAEGGRALHSEQQLMDTDTNPGDWAVSSQSIDTEGRASQETTKIQTAEDPTEIAEEDFGQLQANNKRRDSRSKLPVAKPWPRTEREDNGPRDETMPVSHSQSDQTQADKPISETETGRSFKCCSEAQHSKRSSGMLRSGRPETRKTSEEEGKRSVGRLPSLPEADTQPDLNSKLYSVCDSDTDMADTASQEAEREKRQHEKRQLNRDLTSLDHKEIDASIAESKCHRHSRIPITSRPQTDSAVHVPARIQTDSAVHVRGRIQTDSSVHVRGRIQTDLAVHVRGRPQTEGATGVRDPMFRHPNMMKGHRKRSRSSLPLQQGGKPDRRRCSLNQEGRDTPATVGSPSRDALSLDSSSSSLKANRKSGHDAEGFEDHDVTKLGEITTDDTLTGRWSESGVSMGAKRDITQTTDTECSSTTAISGHAIPRTDDAKHENLAAEESNDSLSDSALCVSKYLSKEDTWDRSLSGGSSHTHSTPAQRKADRGMASCCGQVCDSAHDPPAQRKADTGMASRCGQVCDSAHDPPSQRKTDRGMASCCGQVCDSAHDPPAQRKADTGMASCCGQVCDSADKHPPEETLTTDTEAEIWLTGNSEDTQLERSDGGRHVTSLSRASTGEALCGEDCWTHQAVSAAEDVKNASKEDGGEWATDSNSFEDTTHILLASDSPDIEQDNHADNPGRKTLSGDTPQTPSKTYTDFCLEKLNSLEDRQEHTDGPTPHNREAEKGKLGGRLPEVRSEELFCPSALQAGRPAACPSPASTGKPRKKRKKTVLAMRELPPPVDGSDTARSSRPPSTARRSMASLDSGSRASRARQSSDKSGRSTSSREAGSVASHGKIPLHATRRNSRSKHRVSVRRDHDGGEVISYSHPVSKLSKKRSSFHLLRRKKTQKNEPKEDSGPTSSDASSFASTTGDDSQAEDRLASNKRKKTGSSLQRLRRAFTHDSKDKKDASTSTVSQREKNVCTKETETAGQLDDVFPNTPDSADKSVTSAASKKGVMTESPIEALKQKLLDCMRSEERKKSENELPFVVPPSELKPTESVKVLEKAECKHALPSDSFPSENCPGHAEKNISNPANERRQAASDEAHPLHDTRKPPTDAQTRSGFTDTSLKELSVAELCDNSQQAEHVTNGEGVVRIPSSRKLEHPKELRGGALKTQDAGGLQQKEMSVFSVSSNSNKNVLDKDTEAGTNTRKDAGDSAVADETSSQTRPEDMTDCVNDAATSTDTASKEKTSLFGRLFKGKHDKLKK